MEQPFTYPSIVNDRTEVTPKAEAGNHADVGAHSQDLIIGIGAILMGWAIVATWILLFITCITSGRGLLNAWL